MLIYQNPPAVGQRHYMTGHPVYKPTVKHGQTAFQMQLDCSTLAANEIRDNASQQSNGSSTCMSREDNAQP